jgi:hypothetical protein
VWLASPAMRVAGRLGLGCRVVSLGNLVVSAPGVGFSGVAVPVVDSGVWCSIVASRDRAGDAVVVVCRARLSSSPRRALDEVVCHAATWTCFARS